MRPLIAALAVAACSRAAAPTIPPAPPPPPPAAPATLEALTAGQSLLGWKVTARFVDDEGKPRGGSFVHEATGFQLDYLAIDSAPQAYIWVRSYPTSDKGEPHTQEHLLLGKGKKGRSVANIESMALSESNAFTAQWHTSYNLNAPGPATYWRVLESSLDGLLNPDYTDDEIRGEVRNFGVSTKNDGTLVLEEKGTVYQEMVRSYEQSAEAAWEAAGDLIYGKEHPLSYSAGGTPEAIRAMTPEDIRRFHADHYHLANMGMIASLPPSVPLADVLARHGEILNRLAGRKGPVFRDDQLPRPAGAKPGTVAFADFPSATTTEPGIVFVIFAPTRDLKLEDRLLLELFMDAMAGDESTELYKLLVDSKTRVLDTGAQQVGASVSRDQGNPVIVQLTGVPPRSLTPETLSAIRGQVVAAIRRVAEAPDGSEAAAALNARVRSRLTDLRRSLTKAAGSPPRFGIRDNDQAEFWMQHLRQMALAGGFDRSLTLRPQLDAIEKELAGSANPWRRAVKTWKLLDDEPAVLGARPSPELLARNAREREARVAAETKRIGERLGAGDARDVLQRFKAESDAQAEKTEAQAGAELPPFTDSPPMTYDDALHAETRTIGGVPTVAATFEGMAGAEVGMAFRLDAISEEDLLYVGLLPSLLRQVGVASKTEIIPYDEMTERLRKEVLSLDVSSDASIRTGRVELVVTASGIDVEETRRALGWMERVLLSPDWRAENLPRLRDLVARQAVGLRGVLGTPEEGWWSAPGDAVLMQRSPLYLRSEVFLTAAYDAHRLRWLLEDAGAQRAAVVRFLSGLERSGSLGRAKLEALTASLQNAKTSKLPEAARPFAAKAAGDLGELLDSIPDATLAADWRALCRQMEADLQKPPAEALAGLARVRAAVVRAGNARAWIASSPSTAAALEPDLAALFGKLAGPPVTRPRYAERDRIFERIAARGGPAKPEYLGLLNRSTGAGMVTTSAPGAAAIERDEQKLLRYLSGNLYAGHGSHGVFMKTWGAGLAYSNGLRPRPLEGRFRYYAERSPRIPQTLRFVAGVLDAAKPDPKLVDYAVSQAFITRGAEAYEKRAHDQARDLADGVTPDLVRGFREKLLELRRRPDITQALFDRLQATDGEVVPGLGPPSLRGGPGTVYLVVGPESQLGLFEEALKQTEAGAPLTRIYPRDYWIP